MSVTCYSNQLEWIDLSKEWFQQRTHLFGDGHFTTAKIEQGQVVWWDYHLDRLKSANLNLKFNGINWLKLSNTVSILSKDIESGIIKVQISRGASDRGYQTNPEMEPCIFITTSSIEMDDTLTTMNTAIDLSFLKTQLGVNPMLAGFKHCNRLEQVLASHELQELGDSDGIVCDINNNVIETTKANLFWFNGNHWCTPDLSEAGIEGVFKRVVLDRFTDLHIVKTKKDELQRTAKAMFVGNSVFGFTPIKSLNNKALDVSLSESVFRKLFRK